MNITSQNELNWRNNNELATETVAKVEGGSLGAHNEKEAKNLNAFGSDGLTFSDFIDIINPLHHLPIVGTIYRDITGDQLDPASKVLGGSLFLGPIGSVSALVNILVNEATGKDVTEHALAMFENTNKGQPPASVNKPENLSVGGAPVTKTKSIYSNNVNPNEKLDPVTAWATAEASYRQNDLHKTSKTEKIIYNQAKIDKGITTDTQNIFVTDWAKSEVSYRKATSKASVELTKNTKYLITQANLKKPKNNVSVDENFGQINTLRKTEKISNRNVKNLVAMYEHQKLISINNNRNELMNFKTISPAGAIRTGGGWFSDTMLSALEKTKDINKPAQ
jgi:hypothetical protein